MGTDPGIDFQASVGLVCSKSCDVRRIKFSARLSDRERGRGGFDVLQSAGNEAFMMRIMIKPICGYAAFLTSLFIVLTGCSHTKARVSDEHYIVPAEILVEEVSGDWSSDPRPAASELPPPDGVQGAETIPPNADNVDSSPYANNDSPAPSELSPGDDQENIAGTYADNSGDDPAAVETEQVSDTGADPEAAGAEATTEEMSVESPQSLMDTALDFYEAISGVLDAGYSGQSHGGPGPGL